MCSQTEDVQLDVFFIRQWQRDGYRQAESERE
jgi:hypothetical protein